MTGEEDVWYHINAGQGRAEQRTRRGKEGRERAGYLDIPSIEARKQSPFLICTNRICTSQHDRTAQRRPGQQVPGLGTLPNTPKSRRRYIKHNIYTHNRHHPHETATNGTSKLQNLDIYLFLVIRALLGEWRALAMPSFVSLRGEGIWLFFFGLKDGAARSVVWCGIVWYSVCGVV